MRLTGSGLGCPSWPECVPGSYVPVREQAEGFHKYIEFGNRTLTGAVGLGAVLVLFAVWQWAGRRRDLMVPAWIVLGGVVVQAVLGGITVRTGLHPATVSAHFRSRWAGHGLGLPGVPSGRAAGPRRPAVHPLVSRLACWRARWQRLSSPSEPWSPARDRTPATPTSRPASASTREPSRGCTPTPSCSSSGWWWPSGSALASRERPLAPPTRGAGSCWSPGPGTRRLRAVPQRTARGPRAGAHAWPRCWSSP